MARKPTELVEAMTSHHTLVDADGQLASVRMVPARRKYTKDELKGDAQYFTQRVMTWLLEGERLEQMLDESKLKDVAVVFGITTEKMLLLEGQPTQIISSQQQQSLDQALPLLLQEMQRRGLQVTRPPQTIAVTIPPKEATYGRHEVLAKDVPADVPDAGTD